MLILPRRKAGFDVSKLFATTLYTGNGATQTITNGLDLAGKGGLVWSKSRSAAFNNTLVDTERGATKYLISDTTGAEATGSGNSVTDFNVDGYDIGASSLVSSSGQTYASWSFCQSPKFFDIVTYTGNGVSGRQIAHNLGVTPGMIVVKPLNNIGAFYDGWYVRHRSASGTLYLDVTDAASLSFLDITGADNYSITVSRACNENNETYVAYLFAHDDSASGIIQCGSYTGNGASSGPTVTLGWQPQWLLVKAATRIQNWTIRDSARSPANPRSAFLRANTSDAENTASVLDFSSSGFSIISGDSSVNNNGDTYIYVAIRAPS